MERIRNLIARAGLSLRSLGLLFLGYRYYRVSFIGFRSVSVEVDAPYEWQGSGYYDEDFFAHVYVTFECVRRGRRRAMEDAERVIREYDAFEGCLEYRTVGVEKTTDVLFCHPEDFLISRSDVGDAESPSTLFSTLDEYEGATVDSIGMEGTCWQAL